MAKISFETTNTYVGFFFSRLIDGIGRSSPIWQVSEAAKNAEERPRTNELARPKKPHRDYAPRQPIPTPVSANARKAHASSRTEQLARPKSRKDQEMRDPQWTVPKSALNGVTRQRTLQLAQAKKPALGYQEPLEPNRPVSMKALRSVSTERIQILAKPVLRGTHTAPIQT